MYCLIVINYCFLLQKYDFSLLFANKICSKLFHWNEY